MWGMLVISNQLLNFMLFEKLHEYFSKVWSTIVNALFEFPFANINSLQVLFFAENR